MSSKAGSTDDGAVGCAHEAPGIRSALGSEIRGMAQAFAEAGGSFPWPMQTFAWMEACAGSLAGTRTLEVLTVTRGSRAIGVAPMVLSPTHGIEHALVLGVAELIEPTDLVYSDDAAASFLADELIARGRPVLLERVWADAPAVAAIKRAAAGKAAVVERPMGSCPFIALDPSWRLPEEHLNSGRRSDLRRARRHAEEKGAVTTEVCVPGPDQVDALLDEAFEVEARSWKGDAGTAVKLDRPREAFYRAYARSCARDGALRLCFLRIGGRAVAMQYAVELGGRLALLKIGYDAEFAKCSPGMLLMRETIAYAAAKGLASYEFLGTAASWTQMWTKEQRACVALQVYPYGIRGLAALAGKAASSVLGKVARGRA